MSLSNAPPRPARRLLGAVVAGGRASRFGGDKGAALLDGRALIDHGVDLLRPHVAHVVICGRTWPGLESLADRPSPDLGPLGGINAALAFARGYDAVLTIGCDMPRVPHGLLDALLAGGSRYCADAPVLGCWEAALAPSLDALLAASGSRAVRRWAETAGARPVPWGPLANVNTPGDLAAL